MNRPPKDMFPGAIFSTKDGDVEVLEYLGTYNVRVKFLDLEYETTTSTGQLKRGSLKNPMRPTRYGVGYVGVGDYLTRVDGKLSKSYSIWGAILQRCYDPNDANYGSYGGKGVSVCEDWYDYQVFAKWYEYNYIEGYHLDKDLLSGDKKVYSPDTCKFITPSNNLSLRSFS